MPSTKAIKILYCCSESNDDEQMRQQLEEHLSVLKREGVIATWDKGMISAGKEWEKEIHLQLQTADIILPLISSKFIASDYNWDIFAKHAMERHKARTACVVPILLRPVDNYWKVAFPNVKVLPQDARPITEWRPYDKAFANIAKGIREVVEELTDPTFHIKKSFRRIRAVVIPIAKATANALVYVTSATFCLLFRTSRSRRRKRVGLIALAKPFIIVAVASVFILQLPNISKIMSSLEPKSTVNTIQEVTPIGWIWIGLVENRSDNLSDNLPAGEQLLQNVDSQSLPSIDPPFVPSRRRVVTIKNKVNLRKNKSSLSELLDELQPGEKLVINKVEPLLKNSPNSPPIQVWAQVGKCNQICDK